MLICCNVYYNVLFIVNSMNDFVVNIRNLDIIKLCVIYPLIIFMWLDNLYGTFKFYEVISYNFSYL
jgi:hypothetical protein